MINNSYNTLLNRRKRLPGMKGLILLAVLSVAYAAGYLTPTLLARQKYAPAKKVAHAFMESVTSGDYETAIGYGHESFKESFQEASMLESILEPVVADQAVLGKTTTSGQENYLQYSQEVSNLPEREDKSTSATFHLDLVKIDGDWQVISANVE